MTGPVEARIDVGPDAATVRLSRWDRPLGALHDSSSARERAFHYRYASGHLDGVKDHLQRLMDHIRGHYPKEAAEMEATAAAGVRSLPRTASAPARRRGRCLTCNAPPNAAGTCWCPGSEERALTARLWEDTYRAAETMLAAGHVEPPPRDDRPGYMTPPPPKEPFLDPTPLFPGQASRRLLRRYRDRGYGA
jgi:hypothetical protein